ncbi:serine hydrolase domain-containing protein [Kitasatospora sp. NPDC052896]|uniref:serine hydrolase domain-containing protein n=1 Tax=Kitasatospora sp. NPDC052896 TaxID=3364061 RepID=UPI0037C86DE6
MFLTDRQLSNHQPESQMNTLARRVATLSLACSALVATTAAGGTTAFAAAPGASGGGTPASAPGFPALDPAALQAAIDIRPSDQAAGAIARVAEPGQLWRGSSGDTVTGRKVADNAHFHIGSISKTFESVVILQLAAEGRIDLDQSVQSYLPGLIPAGFAPITVRELLTMTSGLPDVFEGGPVLTADQQIAEHLQYRTFDDEIEGTLRPTGRPWPTAHFAPGTEQQYNSLGFRIGGALIEHITGRSYKDEVTSRILEPLHLDQTSVPEDDPTMPTPYLHGYLVNSQGQPVDVSEQGGDPSNMISTPADLDHFISALFKGELLPPAQLNEMFTLPTGPDGKVVPYADDSDCLNGGKPGPACFGAGLMAVPLPNGQTLWGKTGHDFGYANGMFATRDLSVRAVFSVSTTAANNGAPTALSNRLLEAVLAPQANGNPETRG